MLRKMFVIPTKTGIQTLNIKKAARIGVYALVGVLAFSAIAFAAEGGEEVTTMDWVWRVVNFGLIFALLVWIWKKYGKPALLKRIEGVEAALAEAKAAREEALRRLAEVQARLKDKDAEIQALVKVAEENGLKEKARLIAESEKASESIIASAKENIDAELLKAKEALRREAALLAIEMAEKMVKENIKKEDQDRIVEEYITKVGG